MSADQDQLERLVRRTLEARAAEAGPAPAWAGPTRGAERHSARRWSIVLVAAAVVVLAAAGAWVARSTPRHSAPPPQAPVPAPVVRPVCTTTLPPAWQRALQSARVDAGGRTATPLSVAADGAVIALRDGGATPGSKREVVAVTGSGVRVLYPVPDPDRLTATAAYLDGTTLLVGLAASPRPARGTIPGSSAIGLRAVVVVDTASGRSRTLAGSAAAGAASDPSIQALVYLDGVGYWDVEARYGATTGVLHSYDLRGGSDGGVGTVYRGPIGWPRASAAGVGWDDDRASGGLRFAVTAQLPGALAAALTPFGRARLATDGRAYAWYASPTVLGWWAPGHATASYLRLRTPVDAQSTLGGPLVAGEYVLVPDGQLVDVPNRAQAPLPTTGLYDQQARGELLYARGTVIAGLVLGREPGGFVDGYWNETPSQPLRLDVGGLPRFAC